MSTLPRRSFLALGLAAVGAAACRAGGDSAPARTASPSWPRGASPGSSPSGAIAAPAAPALVTPSGGPASPTPRICAATEANIEGPYYRAGAPRTGDLRAAAGATAAAIVLRGVVLSLDCRTPLAGAELDVWQADEHGRYDNDGSRPNPHRAMRMRGKVACDAAGAFSVTTVVPGRYLNGAQYRPAHVHVKVSAPGHRALTTQLYFDDNPYNAVDPFYRPSLLLARSGSDRSCFDFAFVLSPAT